MPIIHNEKMIYVLSASTKLLSLRYHPLQLQEGVHQLGITLAIAVLDKIMTLYVSL